MSKFSNIKQQLIDYINDTVIVEDEEPYIIEDMFANNSAYHGKLTFTGFRHLKKLYDFHEVIFYFELTPNNFNALVKNMSGLYYLPKNAKNIIKIQTTDLRFSNKMKLMSNDFSKLKRDYLTKKS